MRRILLDTSAYAAFMRGHSGVKRAVQQADEIYVTPVVLGELRAGFMRGRWRRKNEEELRTFLASPRVSLVPVDEVTSERYAVILNALWRVGTPLPTNDMWIAASAMQHGFSILTTDRHYQQVRQVVTDWFDV
jgi:tRNA(fMet)-specific endonuclease VapC